MSIKNHLNTVIKSINDFSSRTNMVAINAAIRASKLTKAEGAPFEVLAREIQSMSVQSIDKLSELDALVNEIAELSVLINMSGGQRMLLMKMVNARWMANESLLIESKKLFNENLSIIKNSKINSQKSHAVLNKLESDWTQFASGLNNTEPDLLFNKAIRLIDQINLLINEYEKHAG